MTSKNGIIIMFLTFFILATNLRAQDQIVDLQNGQKYIMSENVEGKTYVQQYFRIDNKSNVLLDGTENYYHVTMPKPYQDDCFGLKIGGAEANNDTITRVKFLECNDGIYIRSWGGSGIIQDCRFITNTRSGMRTGRGDNRNFEISYCKFETNKWGMDLKSTQNAWIHHNEFREDSLYGMMVVGRAEYGPSSGNLIENNIFIMHDAKKWGILLDNDANNNIIRYNQLYYDKIKVTNADSNLFLGNYITNCDSAIVIIGSRANIFEQDTIENSTMDIFLDENSDVTFISTLFDSNKVIFADLESQLTVKWYLDVNIVDQAENPVAGAVVQIYDKDQSLVVTDTTDESGQIDTWDLTSYIRTKNSVEPYSDYSIVTNVEGYNPVSINLTQNSLIVIGPDGIVGIAYEINPPNQFFVKQNYPNPFNPHTNIYYNLPRAIEVTINIYDITGKLVKTLVDDFQSAGIKTVIWDARDKQGIDVSSGIYLYSINAGEFKETKRMVLIR
jgi:flagellar hook assembly protein FlgD